MSLGEAARELLDAGIQVRRNQMSKIVESEGQAAKFSKPNRQTAEKHHPLIGRGATNAF